ncbi:unnamed protein product [Heligmosomoides polygyrus]|uniref:Ig-like domain-containing protein n=1 Tax=Heligmosomoides polygyrus TaxID=6339 RepID=A0A183FK58_HELPZ|nr:unnamed protein product [Heligmosomoides polygyrus]
MPAQIYSKTNENIQLKCTFTGQPLPAVTWEKDGNLVDMKRNYTIISEDGVTILRVECTTLADNAMFSCTVANSFGVQTSHCKVVIEGFFSNPLLLSLASFASDDRFCTFTKRGLDGFPVFVNAFAFVKHTETAS